MANNERPETTEELENISIWDAIWQLYRGESLSESDSPPPKSRIKSSGSTKGNDNGTNGVGMVQGPGGTIVDSGRAKDAELLHGASPAKPDKHRANAEEQRGNGTICRIFRTICRIFRTICRIFRTFKLFVIKATTPRKDLKGNDVSLLVAFFTLLVTIMGPVSLFQILEHINGSFRLEIPEPIAFSHALTIVSLIAFFLICSIAVSSGLSIHGKIVYAHIAYFICFLGFIASCLTSMDAAWKRGLFLFLVISFSLLSICGIILYSFLVYFIFVGLYTIPTIATINDGVSVVAILIFTAIEVVATTIGISVILGNPTDRIRTMYHLMWCIIVLILIDIALIIRFGINQEEISAIEETSSESPEIILIIQTPPLNKSIKDSITYASRTEKETPRTRPLSPDRQLQSQ